MRLHTPKATRAPWYRTWRLRLRSAAGEVMHEQRWNGEAAHEKRNKDTDNSVTVGA
jgi:hypothetical protein